MKMRKKHIQHILHVRELNMSEEEGSKGVFREQVQDFLISFNVLRQH